MAQHTSVFPILIDSRPAYLQSRDSASLLQMPVWTGSMLAHIAERLGPVIPQAPRVVRAFDADCSYDEALLKSEFVREASVPASTFASTLRRYEPSDWLLFVDPRCFPLNGFNPSPILYQLDEAPRLARHLIAMAPTSAGTSECVEFDDAQRVRRVQRYYEAVTWTVAYGVSCSLVPVSALLMSSSLPFGALTELRRALASTALPSRDIAITDAVVDLDLEQSLLALNEGGLCARADALRPIRQRGVVRPGARIVGNVVLHEGAEVSEDATVIGPTVVGANARIGRGAVVAQCVVAPGVAVAEGAVARHRVVVESRPEPPAPLLATSPEFEEGHVTIRHEGSTRRVYPAVKRAVETIFAVASLIIL